MGVGAWNGGWGARDEPNKQPLCYIKPKAPVKTQNRWATLEKEDEEEDDVQVLWILVDTDDEEKDAYF